MESVIGKTVLRLKGLTEVRVGGLTGSFIGNTVLRMKGLTEVSVGMSTGSYIA